MGLRLAAAAAPLQGRTPNHGPRPKQRPEKKIGDGEYRLRPAVRSRHDTRESETQVGCPLRPVASGLRVLRKSRSPASNALLRFPGYHGDCQSGAPPAAGAVADSTRSRGRLPPREAPSVPSLLQSALHDNSGFRLNWRTRRLSVRRCASQASRQTRPGLFRRRPGSPWLHWQTKPDRGKRGRGSPSADAISEGRSARRIRLRGLDRHRREPAATDAIVVQSTRADPDRRWCAARSGRSAIESIGQ